MLSALSLPFNNINDIKMDKGDDGRSVLHRSALLGCWQTLFFLSGEIQKDVNSLDILGETALSYALRNNTSIPRLDTYICVSALIMMGADVNRIGTNRLSPLMLAVLMNDVHLVDLLLKYNADINYRYSTENDVLCIPNKSTALSLACSFTKNAKIVESLMAYKARIHLHVLFHAIQKADADVKPLLLKN